MAINHTNPATGADLREERFGLEVEFYGITRRKAATALARVLGGTPDYTGGCYKKWEVRDAQNRKWTVVYDSSISCAPSFHGEECELNTPVLGWDDIPTVAKVLAAFKAAGAVTDPDTCGIHVHIESSGLTPTSMRTLCNLTNANEDLFTMALGIAPSRRVRWCRETDRNFLQRLNGMKPREMSGIAVIWYNDTDWEDEARVHYHGSRYHLLNLHSFFQGKGVEYRAFNSTLEADEAIAYVHLCMAMSNRAKQVKSASPERPTTDNPKYTFRCLPLRLGLSGDAFKTTREVLTRNLPGNSAWRH